MTPRQPKHPCPQQSRELQTLDKGAAGAKERPVAFINTKHCFLFV